MTGQERAGLRDQFFGRFDQQRLPETPYFPVKFHLTANSLPSAAATAAPWAEGGVWPRATKCRGANNAPAECADCVTLLDVPATSALQVHILLLVVEQ